MRHSRDWGRSGVLYVHELQGLLGPCVLQQLDYFHLFIFTPVTAGAIIISAFDLIKPVCVSASSHLQRDSETDVSKAEVIILICTNI